MFSIKRITGSNPVFNHPLLFWGILLSLLAGGVASLIYATPYGPGLINDSVVYIGGAENILAGNGYSRTSGGGEIKALTVNAPLYSYTLAGISKFGIGLIKSGMVESIICFALNGLLSAFIVLRLTNSRLWALVGTFLVVSSESVLRAHSFALSEPLFMTGMLASIIFISFAIEKESWIFPAAAGLMVSITYLTRYIGFSILGTGLLVLFLFPPSWRQKFIKIGWFLAFSLTGGLIWGGRNLLISGNPANRTLLFHPLTLDKLKEGTQSFLSFLFPDRLHLYSFSPAFWDGFTILILFTLIGLVYFFWMRSKKATISPETGQIQTAFITAIQAVLYLVVLFLSLTLFDASTALENRILVPVFLCIILLFVFILHLLWKSEINWMNWAALFLGGLAMLSSLYDGRRTVLELHNDGQGYASAYYRNSLTIDALKRMPKTIIWTNRVPAVNILTDRPAYALLAPIDPLTRLKRPNYDSSLLGIRQSVLSGESILVVFEAKQVLEDPIEGEWLRDLTVGIPAAFESDDGMIFAKSAN